jgi:YD repeat-containing protein
VIGRLVRHRVAHGKRDIEQEYDEVSNPTVASDAAGARWTTVFDAEGRVVDEINPVGLESRVEYDAEGRPTRSWLEFDGDASTLRAFGTVVPPATTSQQRLIARVLYDGTGRVTDTFDAAGSQSRITYDTLGRRKELRTLLGTPEEGLVSFEYDLSGRMISRTERISTSSGNRSVFVRYDAAGRLEEIEDPLGRATELGYDELGRLIESRDPLGVAVRYQHDRAGRLLKRVGGTVEDAYSYDGFGRQVLAQNAGRIAPVRVRQPRPRGRGARHRVWHGQADLRQ